MSEKTIFEQIIDRAIPADIVYEDDNHLAFMDINPVRAGHLLLITKKPYPLIQDVPETEAGEIFSLVPRLINAMKESLDCEFVQIMVWGLDVPHFHIHLIPRYSMSEKPEDFDHTETTDKQRAELAQKIRAAL